jgi:hypothetical protein
MAFRCRLGKVGHIRQSWKSSMRSIESSATYPFNGSKDEPRQTRTEFRVLHGPRARVKRRRDCGKGELDEAQRMESHRVGRRALRVTKPTSLEGGPEICRQCNGNEGEICAGVRSAICLRLPSHLWPPNS